MVLQHCRCTIRLFDSNTRLVGNLDPTYRLVERLQHGGIIHGNIRRSSKIRTYGQRYTESFHILEHRGGGEILVRFVTVECMTD